MTHRTEIRNANTAVQIISRNTTNICCVIHTLSALGIGLGLGLGLEPFGLVMSGIVNSPGSSWFKLHPVSQKTGLSILARNFGKCSSIFKILYRQTQQ